MERHAKAEPGVRRLVEQAQRVRRAAAELPRQRPVGPSPVGTDAHIHRAARCLTNHLVELGLGIHGEGPHPAVMGVGDVFLLLYGVTERQAGRIDTELEAPFDLARTGHIKTRPDLGQPVQDLWRRIGLHREKDPSRRAEPRSAAGSEPRSDPSRRQETAWADPGCRQEPTDRLRGPGCIQPTVNICCAHTTPALSICIAPTPTPLNTAASRRASRPSAGPGSHGLAGPRPGPRSMLRRPWRRRPEIRRQRHISAA